MVQEWGDLFVQYLLSADFVADLPNPDPAKLTQELPLAAGVILVQNVHAITGSETIFGA